MYKSLEELIQKDLFKKIDKSNLKDSEILKKCNINKSTLVNWRKKIPDTITNYFKIQEVLGIQFESFFESELGETEKELLELFSKIENEKNKIKIIGRLEELVEQLETKELDQEQKSAI